MSVKVYNLSKIEDAEGNIQFDAAKQDMTIPWVVFPLKYGQIQKPEEIRPYWQAVEHETRQELLAFLAKPPEPIDQSTVKSGLGVALPLPNSLMSDPDYDIISEILPEVGEAVMHNLAFSLRLSKAERKKFGLAYGIFEDENAAV